MCILNGKKLLQENVFSDDEVVSLMKFIAGTHHRIEFSNLVLHCHNYIEHPVSGLAQLLRYVDEDQLEGLLIFLKYNSKRRGPENLLHSELMNAIFDKSIFRLDLRTKN